MMQKRVVSLLLLQPAGGVCEGFSALGLNEVSLNTVMLLSFLILFFYGSIY